MRCPLPTLTAVPSRDERALDERLTRLLAADLGVRATITSRPPRGVDPRPDAQSTERDDLTNLATRTLFLSRLRRSIAPEWCVEGLSVLLFDINGFREINERYGYDLADRLLVEVAD